MKNKNHVLAIYGIKDINKKNIEISHDHALAYYEDGILVKYIQEERLTGRKYGNSLHKTITGFLKSENLHNKEFSNRIIFVDNVLQRNFISDDQNIYFQVSNSDTLCNSKELGSCNWYGRQIKAYVLNHELAHIFSCIPYYGHFQENSLLIHFDGGASKGNFSAWKFSNNRIVPIEFHWKLKYLSSFFNANALVFNILGGSIKNHLSIPGKMMGFASYGKYSPEIENWLKENKYFENIWSSKPFFFEQARKFIGYKKRFFDQYDPFIQDIMSTIHTIFERDFVLYLEELKNNNKSDYLYYSGGSALNIKVNTSILDKNLFREVYIPPCCNDSGLAIGAGAFLSYDNGTTVKKVSAFNNNWNISGYKCNFDPEDIKKAATLLLKRKIIGVCNGYGESGPRALGNRSILALADSIKLSRKVSMQIKKREWYRPLAPVMLEKNAKQFTGIKRFPAISKYMLMDFKILEEKYREIEGVVHTDGTARIQVIHKKSENPFLYCLLEFLDEIHGVKALINTSFNCSGAPIVHTTENAIMAGREMGLDAVILNGKVKLLD